MNTVNNGIPFVPENTIDPASGLNLSINHIDAVLQLSVLSVGDNAPPANPQPGSRYIVGLAPAGLWSGNENRIARFLDGAWKFYDARYAVNLFDGSLWIKSESGWSASSGGGGPATNGLPSGGTQGQVLKKLSATDYDAHWDNGNAFLDPVTITASSSDYGLFVKNSGAGGMVRFENATGNAWTSFDQAGRWLVNTAVAFNACLFNIKGALGIQGHILPSVNNSYNLGSNTLKFSNAYITNGVVGALALGASQLDLESRLIDIETRLTALGG